jgi:hypothetical protein
MRPGPKAFAAPSNSARKPSPVAVISRLRRYPAREPSSFSSRFQEALRSVLRTLRIQDHALDQYLLETAEVRIGHTANRSVLESLNELAVGAQYALGSNRKCTS